MADIKVKDLATHNISGTDLFDDSESFMTELSTQNEVDVLGGLRCDSGSAYNISTQQWYHYTTWVGVEG